MNEESGSFFEETEFFMSVIFNIFMVFSITLEVFLRRKFGERYFSGLLFSFSTLLIYTYATTTSMLLLVNKSRVATNDSTAMVIAAFAFLGLSAWHQFSIYRRSKTGERWHSRCGGISWPIWQKIFRCGEDKVQMYIEPLFCLILSFVLMNVSNALHFWLLFASVGMFVKGRLQYAQARKRFLDAMDSQIESECLNAALVERKSAGETLGFTVLGTDSQPLELRKKMVNHFQGLDKGVKDILDSN